MKQTLVIIGLIFFCSTVFGQELFYKNVKWEDAPKWNDLGKKYADEKEVDLLNTRIVQYAYDESDNNNLVEYFTMHKKVRVVSDEAVQDNNKVYIGMGNVIRLIEAKARVITPDGKIVDFDKSNINDNKGEDGSIDYKYFAIDGVINGSDIEYTYTVKRYPNYDGSRMSFQDGNIHTNVDFKIISPVNLVFKIKSYNGFPEMLQDTTYKEQNVLEAKIDFIPGLEKEDYSAYGKNIMHVIYRLDKNTGTGSNNIISFGKISQNVYEYYYTDLEKKDKKALSQFLAKTGALKEKDEEMKIRKVENYIKGNFGIIDGVPTKPLKDILTDGYTSSRGATYLMVQALKTMEIQHELVLGCDRMEDYFDSEFEHYRVLTNIMIYYSKQRKYSAPDEMAYRYGMVPEEWTAADALFIKEVKIGDMKTGLGKVKRIEALGSEMTHDNMEVTVDFEDITQPIVYFERSLQGYTCASFQSIYNLIDEDNKKELDESLITFADPKGEVLEYKLKGIEESDFGVNPMVYSGKLKTTTLIEKAGNRYLFKVGELIGAQAEMYQESARVMDIEHGHNMVYSRKITFVIPDGYELSGLESLKTNEVYPKDSPTIRFVSDYTVTGNKVEITVTEQYDQVHFSKEEINDFRRIINAAANFNKIVLFMVKK
jgi:hypothetical protein